MPIPGIGGCFRCRGRDHWADNCPESLPPADKTEYEARLEKYKQWYWDLRIDAREKQQLIITLNKMWAQMQPAKRRKAS